MLRVQTGQRIYLANLEIEVLMTYEDHAPFNIIHSNDFNTVTRFTIRNKDKETGKLTQAAQVLYLGDSQRHTSRFLCEMYGDYLQTEIVQLAHHGNIGCERVLYETIAPRAVLVANDSGIFQRRLWFNTMIDENAAADTAFLFATDIWCAINAEYTWSAPANTYNTWTFTAEGPDYANVKDYYNGTALTSGSYKSYSGISPFGKGNYIHNTSKARTEVNVYFGEMFFTYQGAIWNPESHKYEGGTWVAVGNQIIVENESGKAVSIQIAYTASEIYADVKAEFKENDVTVAQGQDIALAQNESKEYALVLDPNTWPTNSISNAVIGSITVTVK